MNRVDRAPIQTIPRDHLAGVTGGTMYAWNGKEFVPVANFAGAVSVMKESLAK